MPLYYNNILKSVSLDTKLEFIKKCLKNITLQSQNRFYLAIWT